MSNNLLGRGWAFPLGIGQQGGLPLTNPDNEIQQAIRIILSTAPGERVMRPAFGSRLHELVFAPINTETMMLARRYVEEALKMWEPRITLGELTITPNAEHSALLISLEYELKGDHDRRSLIYPFYIIPAE